MEYVYPGPQTEAVNKSFGRSMDRMDRLAQLGMVVIAVGNRGGNPIHAANGITTTGMEICVTTASQIKKPPPEQMADHYSYALISIVLASSVTAEEGS